jgi:hypothetical protein
MKPEYQKCFPGAKKHFILAGKRTGSTFGEVKILTTQFDAKFLCYDLWQSVRVRTFFSYRQGKVVSKLKKKNSVACSPQANYTDRAAAAC